MEKINDQLARFRKAKKELFIDYELGLMKTIINE
jgi:hypothetical protein